MKRIKFPLFIAVLVGFAALAHAGLDEGKAAYKRGDYAMAFKEFKAAADQGNANAQYDLGLMYQKGQGVPKNYAEAAEWYRKAAEQGNAVAQDNLGFMYANGLGVPKDNAEAMKWWSKASDQGDATAQNNLRTMLLSNMARPLGNGPSAEKPANIPRPVQRAPQPPPNYVTHPTMAASGNLSAQTVTVIGKTPEGTPIIVRAGHDEGEAAELRGNKAYSTGDFATALKEWKVAAVQGNAAAQYDLGGVYASGLMGTKDTAEAMQWYRKAADQGNAGAQYDLGGMYANGQGVPQNYGEAMQWYRKAADRGNEAAQYHIGLMYANGQGVPQNYGEAMEWYRKAADQGNGDAQYDIGLMYANGQGVPKNDVEAMKWYREAAGRGNAAAQNKLSPTLCKKMQANTLLTSIRQLNMMLLAGLKTNTFPTARGILVPRSIKIMVH